ncbi:MAG: outer membrane beta-barrel protein, partial [Flavitalea sp.]
QQNFSTQDLLGVTSNQSGGGGGGQRGGGGRGGAGGSNRGGGGNFGGNSNNFLVGQQNGISKTNSFGLNFADILSKKLEISGSYFFNNNNNTNKEISRREYFGSVDSIRVDNEISSSSSTNSNHRMNLRVEYKIDSNNSIIITPSINFQKNTSFNNFIAENFYQPYTLINKSINQNKSSSDGYNINNNILYRHAFPKRGRSISLSLNTGLNNRDRESYVDAINTYYKGGLITDTDSLLQFSDQLTKGYQLSANLAYTEPIGKRGQLQINYNPRYSKNKADQQTFQFNESQGKYSQFDTSLSNKYDNDYSAHRGGITYRVGNRDNMFSIGTSYQHSRLKGDQVFPASSTISKTFSNLLPEIMWRKKISAKSSLRLFYRSSTNEPSITQLQDVINNSNPLQIKTGNPDLQQQYTHRLVSRYSYTNSAKAQSFFANLFIEKTDNYIGNLVYFSDSDTALTPSVILRQGSQLSKPVNLDGYWSIRSFLTYGMPLKFIKSSLNWNAGFSWSNLPGLVKPQGVPTITNTSSNTYNYNVGAVLASNISEYVDFNINYSATFSVVKSSLQADMNSNYFNHSAGMQLNLLSKKGWLFQNDLSNQYYKGLSDGFNQNFWLWNMSAGKKFLKDQKGEIKLSVFDLLKQNRSITRNITETYTEDIQNQVLQQYFMLTFSYRLRNFGAAARQRNN